MGLRDKMQQLTASLQQSQGTQQLQPVPAAVAAAPAAAPPPVAVAAAPAQPPPRAAAAPVAVPAASQQPTILATGLTRVSLVRQAQMAAASQAAAATQQAAAAAPLSQPDASQGYNQDDYIWIGGRRIRKEGTSGRAAPTLSQLPVSQQTQQAQQPQSQQQADGIDRSAARAVVAVPAGKDAFDDDFDLGPLPRAAQNGGRGSGGSRPQPRAAPLPASDSEEDALLGLLPRPSPKAASKQRGKRGGKAAAPGGSARKAAAGGSSRAQARKGAAPQRKAQRAAAQDSGEEEGSEDDVPRPSQRRARGGGSGGGGGARKRKQPDAEDEEEAGTQAGGLLDQLLAEESQQPAAGATPAPVAAPADRPAAAGRGSQQPRAQAQQQAAAAAQQQVARPPAVRPNAPTDGPDEDLILRAEEDGSEVPLDAPEEPFLELAVPASINKYLRSYQRDGIRFLFRQYARGTGGVLADDMGLGKTIQAIGFIAALLGKTGGPEDAYSPELPRLEQLEAPLDESYELLEEEWAPRYQDGGAPILVVAPTSVLSNWEREFETWGHFRVVLCHGGQRDSALAGILHGKKEVMIVSYDTMRTMEEAVLTVPWHAVIFDEAHLLKNEKSQRYQIANRLPTRLRFGLTGTPFQNDYAEIFNVMDFFAPDCLGQKKEFNREMAKPIMRGQKSTATDEQIADGKEAQRALRAVLQEYMLRRTKALIADQLPKKLDKIVFCELTPLQLRAYQRVLQSPDMELILRYKEEPCPGCGSMQEYFKCCGWRVDEDQGGVLWPMYHLCECEDPGPYDKDMNPKGCKCHKPDGCWRMTKFGWRRMCPFCLVLPICSILRKISNHMELVKAEHTDRESAPMKFGKALQIAQLVIGEDEEELGGYVTTEEFLRLRDTSTCGKMQVLVSLLDTWAAEGGNKVLLFSNSVRLLRILHSVLDARAYDYLMLDGSVAQQDRQAMVDQFNSSPSTFVFLISSLAGGVGLNLTAANKVIIFDPSWNPAVDLQAQDRAFRLGQQRDVSVYRFVAAGTMEEMIYSRQLYKQQHSKMVLEGAAMPRMWEGAKTTDKADQGELWGMHNLLKMNAEGILSVDRLEEQRQRRGRGERGVRIEDFDADAAVQQGARATAAAAESDEDVGLEALVEQQMAALVEAEEGDNGDAPAAGRGDTGGGGSGAGNGGSRGGGGEEEGSEQGRDELAPGELLAREAATMPLNDAQRREAEVLRAAGITGTMLHTLAFVGAEDEEEVVERVEQQRSHAAAAQAAAAATNAAKRPRQLQLARQAKYAATAAVGASDGLVRERELPLLESLAQLMGLSVREAGRALLDMTPERRAELRRGFAAQDDPSLGLGNGSGGKGGKQGSSDVGGDAAAAVGAAAVEAAAEEHANGIESEGGSKGPDPDYSLEPEFEVQTE